VGGEGRRFGSAPTRVPGQARRPSYRLLSAEHTRRTHFRQILGSRRTHGAIDARSSFGSSRVAPSSPQMAQRSFVGALKRRLRGAGRGISALARSRSAICSPLRVMPAPARADERPWSAASRRMSPDGGADSGGRCSASSRRDDSRGPRIPRRTRRRSRPTARRVGSRCSASAPCQRRGTACSSSTDDRARRTRVLGRRPDTDLLICPSRFLSLDLSRGCTRP